MTAKVLLDAISGIDDVYIEKFARKRAVRLRSPWGLVASAAALCMVIASVVFLRNAGLLPAAPTEGTEPSTTVTEPTTETTAPETTEYVPVSPAQPYGPLVFWAEEAAQNGNRTASAGQIVYSDGLLRALEYFEDEPNTVFAIRVLESTGADFEDVYREFIRKLNVKEYYMEHGLIYATRQQLEQIRPSEEFAIVFRLAYKQDFDTTIHDIEDIALLVEDQYRLEVRLDVGYSDEYTQEQRDQRFDSMLPGVLAAYGLTEEDTEILREDHAFVMTGNVDMVTKLSDDPRVRWLQVLWHEDLFVVYPPEYAAKHPAVWVPEE